MKFGVERNGAATARVSDQMGHPVLAHPCIHLFSGSQAEPNGENSRVSHQYKSNLMTRFPAAHSRRHPPRFRAAFLCPFFRPFLAQIHRIHALRAHTNCVFRGYLSPS